MAGAHYLHLMSRIDYGEDLFGECPLPGFGSQVDVVSPDEEAALVARIEAEGLAPFRFHGWTGKRETRSFGWSYDFASGRFERCEPVPEWLLPVRQRAAEVAGIAVDRLEQVLLTRYDPGAGIGWHRDRSVFAEVLGLSLGAAVDMRFRKREGNGFRRLAMPLSRRALYRISGEARRDWEHSISPVAQRRWSITFRTLA